MFKKSVEHRRRSKVAIAAGVAGALAAGALALPLLAGPAAADTPAANVATLATTPYQSNVATPGGTLTGLKNGDAVSLTINASAGASVFGAEVRQCRGGANITNDAGFDPTSTTNCLDAPFNASSQEYASGVAGPPNTTMTFSINVGTGTHNNASPATTINCDINNPCTLWLRESVSSGSTSTAWVHYNLNFAGPPDAPTGLTATPGSGQVNFSWTAPVNTGGSAIANYTISGNFPGSPVTVPASPTNHLFTGLTNFTPYNFSIVANNAAGFTSPVAGPASATPGPSAPSFVSATAGDQQVALVWNTNGENPNRWRIVPHDVTTNTDLPAVYTANGAATGLTVTGLTNGHSYNFRLAGEYLPGPVFGPEVTSGNATPNGTFVTQVIYAARPAGTIDIAEACSIGYTGGPQAGLLPPGVTTSYANNPAAGQTLDQIFGQYPQTCDLSLGTGVLNAAGTAYVTPTTNINPVTVRDLRDTDTGWNVSTQLTAFNRIGGGGTFSGDCLSFTPTFTEQSNNLPVYEQGSGVPGFAYSQAATTGTGTAIGGTCAGGGLNGSTVMTAQVAHGLGKTELSGPVVLNIPTNAPSGNYTATLTFTVLGN